LLPGETWGSYIWILRACGGDGEAEKREVGLAGGVSAVRSGAGSSKVEVSSRNACEIISDMEKQKSRIILQESQLSPQ
jgi:hypothetical protein